MSLSSSDRAETFGMFLFLVIVAFAVICYAIVNPFMTEMNAAFDSDYRDEYMTTEGKEFASFIYYFFEHSVLVLFIVIVAAIMVINRSIERGRL